VIGQQPAADSLAKQNMQQVLEKIATSFTACPLKSYRIAKLEHINHILKHSSLKMCAKLDENWRETFRVIVKQESVRPRWPYDMRPSVRAEKYIRDASG